MNRLKSIIITNNHIMKISFDLGGYLAHLESLVLTNNKIASFSMIDAISSLKSLQHLILTDNPLSLYKFYRLYVVYRLPWLKSLDFIKINTKEREITKQFFESTEGIELLHKIASEAPKESFKGSTIASDSIVEKQTTNVVIPPPKPITVTLTQIQKDEIRQALDKANTKEELDSIEYQLKTGTFVFQNTIVKTAEEETNTITNDETNNLPTIKQNKKRTRSNSDINTEDDVHRSVKIA